MPVVPRRSALVALIGLLGVTPLALAGEATAPKIRDNLFLLEEAYNQEPGVIQHIQSLQLNQDQWAYSFTEEWPVPTDRHQLSVTAPVFFRHDQPRMALGDLMLNYRLQALGVGGEGWVALAPRVSAVLPTGNFRQGEGRGAWGVQTNLPVSLDLHANFVAHLNAGLTYTPNARSLSGARGNPLDTTLGLGLVWLPVPWANGLVEVLHVSTEEFDAAGLLTRDQALIVNPGVRFAIDFPSGLQVVPGVSAPIESRGGQVSVSALAYLSFEHPLWR